VGVGYDQTTNGTTSVITSCNGLERQNIAYSYVYQERIRESGEGQLTSSNEVRMKIKKEWLVGNKEARK
jgi:hypothetical protein